MTQNSHFNSASPRDEEFGLIRIGMIRCLCNRYDCASFFFLFLLFYNVCENEFVPLTSRIPSLESVSNENVSDFCVPLPNLFVCSVGIEPPHESSKALLKRLRFIQTLRSWRGNGRNSATLRDFAA